jgi:UDP-N-acetylglucosamine 3-dehydrogenase
LTVKLAIVGCGSIARRAHIPALTGSGDVDIVAFVSRTRASAEAAASECGGGPVFDDWREVTSSDDVDAVDICSPNAFHRDQTVAAAEAGKHVLVEKPIARTVREADDMIEAADKAGVVLHVAHNLRYIAPVIAARDFVRSGRLGQIVGIRSAFGHSGPKDWAPDSTWFFDAELAGGGALIDLGIHIIDLVRFVTGLEALEVSAMTFGSEAVEDAAQVIVRYEGGAVGSVHASWVARPAPDMSLSIFGTEGTLQFDARTPLTFRPATGDKEKIELPSVDSSPYLDFVSDVLRQPVRGPAATGVDGRAALAIVCAAYESARTGDTVEVER